MSQGWQFVTLISRCECYCFTDRSWSLFEFSEIDFNADYGEDKYKYVQYWIIKINNKINKKDRTKVKIASAYCIPRVRNALTLRAVEMSTTRVLKKARLQKIVGASSFIIF